MEDKKSFQKVSTIVPPNSAKSDLFPQKHQHMYQSALKFMHSQGNVREKYISAVEKGQKLNAFIQNSLLEILADHWKYVKKERKKKNGTEAVQTGLLVATALLRDHAL